MIVYVPVGSGPLREKIIAAGHGMIVSRPFRVPTLRCPWVLDNGAFIDWKRDKPFDGDAFRKAVSRTMALPEEERPRWCVCPDRVASPKSLHFSTEWRRILPDDLDWYLAIQDGMKREEVQFVINRFSFQGFFIGGSSGWKNAHAWEWVEWAHELGLRAHIGRVNGWRRLQWAVNIEADSIDGTGWTRDPRWVEYLRDLPQKQKDLWGS